MKNGFEFSLKKFGIIFLLQFFSLNIICQTLRIDFESKIIPGTITFVDRPGHKNIWQIGRPNKTVFDSAYSIPNCIVTDTLNSYPANDTSSFIIGFKRTLHGNVFGIDFNYRINTDSMKDFGILEISTDSPKVWYNFDTKNRFCGNSNGWVWGGYDFGFIDVIAHGRDSIYFRFTFISDSIQNSKDGWMIDNIVIYSYYHSGINQISGNNSFSIYPNPSHEICKIVSDNAFRCTFKIFNSVGQVHDEGILGYGEMYEWVTRNKGFYFIQFYNESGILVETQKLIVH